MNRPLTIALFAALALTALCGQEAGPLRETQNFNRVTITGTPTGQPPFPNSLLRENSLHKASP